MWTTISNRFYLLPSLPLIYSASYCQTIGLKILLCDSNNLRICNPGIRGTARSNQSILKEINPEHSLEGLMLKLKLQYFGHLMRRTDSLEKTLMLGKIEGRRRRGWQRIRWLDGITDLMDMCKLQVLVMDREACRAAVHGVTKNQIRLSNWPELNWIVGLRSLFPHSSPSTWLLLSPYCSLLLKHTKLLDFHALPAQVVLA